MSRPDILREIEEKVRERYFQDVGVLRLPESVLTERNYTDVMIPKLYKYGYYDPDKPEKKRLKDKALQEREGLVKTDFNIQCDELLAEYNQLLHDVDQQIEQRIHEAIQQSNRKPAELRIVQIITGPNHHRTTSKSSNTKAT